MASIITIDRVTKWFGTTMAVRNLSLEVEEGTIFALLGPNGAGKTTTVRLLNGILTPDQGSMQVLGYDVTTSAHTIRNLCGVQTDTNLYDKLTAEDNLVIWGGFFGLQGNALRSRIEDLLEMFDLTQRKEDLVGTFSKGMRQKLSIARALIHNPELLFLDEPTAGLDPEASHEVLQYLEAYALQSGRTVFLCSHRLEEVEKLSQRVAILYDGSILAAGSIPELVSAVHQDVRVTIEVAQIRESLLKSLRSRDVQFEPAQSEQTLNVVLSDRAEIPEIVSILVEAGAEIFEVREERPSLQDVYLELLPRENNAN